MITFNNLREMKDYYDEETNTYIFNDDVVFKFDLNINANIKARDIKGLDINAKNIDVWHIRAWDIVADNINACDINAYNVEALNIWAWDINTNFIVAVNIDAYDIKAWGISAYDIKFKGVCFAYKDITCKFIQGKLENSKYFVLDGKIKIEEN